MAIRFLVSDKNSSNPVEIGKVIVSFMKIVMLKGIYFTLLLFSFKFLNVCTSADGRISAVESMDDWFIAINNQYLIQQQLSAALQWNSTIEPTKENMAEALNFQLIRGMWRNRRCTEAAELSKMDLTFVQKLMLWKLCRGPRYTQHEAKITFNDQPTNKMDYEHFSFVEPMLTKIMTGDFETLKRSNCKPNSGEIFLWAWEVFHLAVGFEIVNYYPSAVTLMNIGARNNDYDDIGQYFREEFEVYNAAELFDSLWHSFKPLYKLLYSFLRIKIIKKHRNESGELMMSNFLPAHLLGKRHSDSQMNESPKLFEDCIVGSIWSEDWSSHHKLLAPVTYVDIDKELQTRNWTVHDMISRVDDFFTSMGINPLPDAFWSNSRLESLSNSYRDSCSHQVQNMFNGNEYRIAVCNSDKSVKSLKKIVNGIGQIQYFMHLKHLPPLFQDAPNPAMMEAISNAIFTAMMSPQHLNRLRLLPEKFLASEEKISIDEKSREDGERCESISSDDEKFIGCHLIRNTHLNFFDYSHLLQMALSEIPMLSFNYLLSKWHWKYFHGDFGRNIKYANSIFWKMSIKERGIYPSNRFNTVVLDSQPDKAIYMNQFLSSFLQAQIFKGLCERTIYGRFNTSKKLPMPLHRCDIYGSKRAGKILKEAFSTGSSAHWSQVLFILTGSREISVKPLLEYYEPLFNCFNHSLF